MNNTFVCTQKMKEKYFDSDGRYLKEDITVDEFLAFLKDYNKYNDKGLGEQGNDTFEFIINPNVDYLYI